MSLVLIHVNEHIIRFWFQAFHVGAQIIFLAKLPNCARIGSQCKSMCALGSLTTLDVHIGREILLEWSLYSPFLVGPGVVPHVSFCP